MEVYTVYIICNPQNSYYKGFTSDVLRRLEEHNSSVGKYTSEKVLEIIPPIITKLEVAIIELKEIYETSLH